MLQGKHYRFTILGADTRDLVKSASHRVESWTASLLDVLPPYYVVEGSLQSKRVDDRGRYILLVNGAPLSVDRHTYNVLDIGENIRVRYTRGARAINIDRFKGPNGAR